MSYFPAKTKTIFNKGKGKEFVINNETFMDCIQNYRRTIMVYSSFYKKDKSDYSDKHTEIENH